MSLRRMPVCRVKRLFWAFAAVSWLTLSASMVSAAPVAPMASASESATVSGNLDHIADMQSPEDIMVRAEAGDAEAQFALGNRYLKGHGLAQDNFAALHWLTLAAEAGNANAQYNIAVMYLNGLGVVTDSAQAVQWFVKAAENGDTPSQYTLAILLFNGQLGVPRNVPQAYKWFTLAGAAGHQTAAANAVLVQELLPANEIEAMQADARAWIETYNLKNATQALEPALIP